MAAGCDYVVEAVLVYGLDLRAGVVVYRGINNNYLVSSVILRSAKLGQELLTTFD